jgi:hypothetical protein
MHAQAHVSGNLVDILQALNLFGIAAHFLRTLDWKRMPFLRNNRNKASSVTEASPTRPLLGESIGEGGRGEEIAAC